MTPPNRLRFRTAALVAALLLLTTPALAAHVASLSGNVESGHGEPPTWRPVSAGDALEPGDRVRTGADGRAELVLGRATIRIYPNSLLRVPGSSALADDGDAVELEQGTSLFDVMRGSRPFEVRTPEVVVSVKGTRFSVALGRLSASVAVFRGAVGVRSLAMEAAREVLVREGFVASGHEHFELRVLDLDDPWEAFEAEALPEVPSPGGDPASARTDVEVTRSAALDQARTEAAARAAERHASVRERIAALRTRAQLADARVDDSALLVEGAEPDAARNLATGPVRDTVADAPAAIADALELGLIESWLNAGAPGGGSGSSFVLTLLEDTGGLLEVLLQDPSGGSWLLDEDLLVDVVEGTQSLPTPLVDELVGQGIDDQVVFAEQLLSSLFGR